MATIIPSRVRTLPPVPPGDDPYVSVATAARLIRGPGGDRGVTRKTVYDMLKRGVLTAHPMAGRQAIMKHDIDVYNAELLLRLGRSD